MGQALGPICVSTQRAPGQPFIDGCATQVEKWGDGRHGGIGITIRKRMVVVTLRGTRPSAWYWLWIVQPRRQWHRWRHRNDPRVASGAYGVATDD